jgi:hypothetical protein
VGFERHWDDDKPLSHFCFARKAAAGGPSITGLDDRDQPSYLARIAPRVPGYDWPDGKNSRPRRAGLGGRCCGRRLWRRERRRRQDRRPTRRRRRGPALRRYHLALRLSSSEEGSSSERGQQPDQELRSGPKRKHWPLEHLAEQAQEAHRSRCSAIRRPRPAHVVAPLQREGRTASSPGSRLCGFGLTSAPVRLGQSGSFARPGRPRVRLISPIPDGSGSGSSGSSPAAAGWYPDPDRDGIYRYWDGVKWTNSTYQPEADTAKDRLLRPNPFSIAWGLVTEFRVLRARRRKRCPDCGGRAALDAPVCPRCGHQFATRDEPPPPEG